MIQDIIKTTMDLERLMESYQFKQLLAANERKLELWNTVSINMDNMLTSHNLSLTLKYQMEEGGISLSSFEMEDLSRLDLKLYPESAPNLKPALEFNAQGQFAMDFRQAINITQGRSVLMTYITEEGLNKNGWFKRSTEDKIDRFQMYFRGGRDIYPNYDLGKALVVLPLIDNSKMDLYNLQKNLRKGDMVEVLIRVDKKEAPVYIQATQSTQGVAIFDSSLRKMKLEELTIAAPHKRQVVENKADMSQVIGY